MESIRSAISIGVVPVAGLGTRFLPVTKALPKEMLPVLDKPLIQFIVEEALAAGLTKLIIVTCGFKYLIEDYLDRNYELEFILKERGHTEYLNLLQKLIPPQLEFIYIRQPLPLGLGHAVLCARSVVGDNPFVLMLPDDLFVGEQPLRNMIDLHWRTHSTIVCIKPIPRNKVDQYGIVQLEATPEKRMLIKKIAEKPRLKDAYSNFAVVGRYVFTSRIFQCLEMVEKDVNGEIQLTDAIEKLLSVEHVFAYLNSGAHYDCGSKIGYLQASFASAFEKQELRAELLAFVEAFTENIPKAFRF